MFRPINGHPMNEVLTPAFIQALKKWHGSGEFLFPPEADAEDIEVEDMQEGTTNYDEDTGVVTVTATYRIKKKGAYVLACGELYGPDKHGFHGFHPTRIQIQPLFGSEGDLVEAASSVPIESYWCMSAFKSEADIPIINTPEPIIGIRPKVNSLKLANHFIGPLRELLIQYCKRDPNIFSETTLEEYAQKESASTLVRVGLMTFILRNLVEAILADGEFTKEEGEFVYPIAKAICKRFAKAMGLSQYSDLQEDQLGNFLDAYSASDGPFCCDGGADVTWLAIAQVAAKITESEEYNFDPRPVTLLHDLFCSLYWGVLTTDGISDAEVEDFKNRKQSIFGHAAPVSFIRSLPMRLDGQEHLWEKSESVDCSSASDGEWELRDVSTNQGWEDGRDRSYLLVPLDEFVDKAGFSSSELSTIDASRDKTWWDKGWDTGFKATIGKKLDELGFCNDAGALGLTVMDMGNGPSFSYRLFRVHESFVSLDRKIGDLPRYEGDWFITIYDKEAGTTPYKKLCSMMGVNELQRYNWSVFE